MSIISKLDLDQECDIDRDIFRQERDKKEAFWTVILGWLVTVWLLNQFS